MISSTEKRIYKYGVCFSRNCGATLMMTAIEHFTVVCLVARPLNENEAGDDLVLIQTSLLFLCKFLLISMRIASLT